MVSVMVYRGWVERGQAPVLKPGNFTVRHPGYSGKEQNPAGTRTGQPAGRHKTNDPERPGRNPAEIGLPATGNRIRAKTAVTTQTGRLRRERPYPFALRSAAYLRHQVAMPHSSHLGARAMQT